jgi:hypothetical protein
MAIEDIIITYDFLTKEENEILLSYMESLDAEKRWSSTSVVDDPYRQWDGRLRSVGWMKDESAGFGHEEDLKVYAMVADITDRIKQKIEEVYAPAKPIYHDGVNLIKWPHGFVQPAHSDFENYGGEPHVFNWRQIGCVVYLNDTFDGGEVHFPQHGVQVPIKPGMMAFFPGDVHHSHGVQRVLNGNRYTLTLFWTEFEEHWEKGMKDFWEANRAR